MTRRTLLTALLGTLASAQLAAFVVFARPSAARPGTLIASPAIQSSPVSGRADLSGAPAGSGTTRHELLSTYCLTCHSARLKTGGLVLEGLDDQPVPSAAETWEKVVKKLRSGAMPPSGSPQPSRVRVEAVVSAVEAELDASAAASPNPGSAAMRRLNRTEYVNAVRDLLHLEIDGDALLPPDNADHGFDNQAGSLTVSPALFERYLSAARKISRLVIGDPTTTASATTYRMPSTLFQDARTSDDLPFGSRGGLAVEHFFPLDGQYAIKVTLKKNYTGYVVGLDEPQDLQVRVDGVLVKQFRIGGATPGRPAPDSFAGNVLGDAAWESYLHSADENLAVELPIKAGPHLVGVSFIAQPRELEGVAQPPLTGVSFSIDEGSSSPWGRKQAALESVTLSGPHSAAGSGETPASRRVLICTARRSSEERTCAAQILSTLARRAYRRPITEPDAAALLRFYELGRTGGTFESGIQAALERMLVDPDFLFRPEPDPERKAAGYVRQLTDFELASRLSFFLWSSIPDDTLLDLAAKDRLHQAGVLATQVRRMLADRKAEALVDNFAGQWLHVRNVATIQPAPDLFFPDFNDNLRAAFLQETRLFLNSQIRGNRPVIELLTADYSFLNDLLARHYRIPNVHGSAFRRVVFTDGIRGGLLGQGGVLAVTSYGDRTSPVLRGHWLLANVLGAPPPPPPPNIPALRDTDGNGKTLAMRQRMEQHRRSPACAGCHSKMDPLGFSLENFDAIGRWRTIGEGGTPIDATGLLPDGTRFDGIRDLRTVLSTHADQFAQTVVEKLLIYALGRPVEAHDMPAVRRILREGAAEQWRWSSLVLGVVNSVPFQKKTVGG